jgi:hypothetical protein
MPARSFRILSVIGICALFIVAAVSNSYAREKKDYLVVLDTSYSMAGSGGKNIIESVKTSLNGYIDRIESGDTLTFVTFADDVKIYPTVKLEDKNDRDIVKKYISVTEANGHWTYTLEMVKKVLKKADELQAANKDHQIVIVIMTDTLDDPPPSKRGEKLSIKDIAKNYQGGEWYIYLVSLGDIQKNARVQKMASDLSTASSKTKVVTQEDPTKAITQVESSVKDQSDQKSRIPVWVKILLAIAALLVLFLLFVIIRNIIVKMAFLRVKGFLDYRYSQSPYKSFTSVDLSKIDEKRISIGNGSDFRVNIRDYSLKNPVIIEARRFEGAVHPVVNEELSPPVEFLNGKNTIFLNDGDSFKAGEIIFVYRENA